jgi:hypothetical protein
MTEQRKDLDLSRLPDWLREDLDSARAEETAQPSPPSVSNLMDKPAWHLLLDAALASSFDPGQLARGELDGEDRAAAERSVLDFALQVYEPNGVRWALTPVARAQAIESSSEEQLAQAASRSASEFPDAVSTALRTLAIQPAGQHAQPADLGALEAQRTALTMLSEARGVLSLPSLEQIERTVQRDRLLARFRRMTGASVDADGRPVYRFYGRENEMKALRVHVDVVSTGSVFSPLGQVARATVRRLIGVPPLCIWGTGGVGKTTLMAMFMLEHANAAADHYPFAYLDFDRPTISARDPVGLLVEMCRQVGVQFDELDQPLANLSVRLGELARRSGQRVGVQDTELISLQGEFRSAIDGYLESQESLFDRSRPLLLVLDTFEVVQYSADDIKALEVFIAFFARPDEGRLWPRLRLVVSGRNKLTEFLGTPTTHELGPLNEAGSTTMLVAQATEAGLTVTDGDARRLARALAEAGGSPQEGVHPLRLRLVGELFQLTAKSAAAKKQVLNGKTLVNDLIRDLKEPGSEISQALVSGFLVRRILGHLVDPEVKALTDPGLVVRLITRDVIRDVMTQATPMPVDGGRDDKDTLDFPPWSIDDARAQHIFDAFRKEVTLVEDTTDGLRFRQEVRREMLPLIRTRPNRFRLVHQKAWEHFTGLVKDHPERSATAAGEAVYHGLWLEQPLELVDRYWLDDRPPFIDAEEFDRGSQAALFLRAKSGARLELAEVERLAASGLALEWLRHQGSVLRDSRMNETVTLISAAVRGDYDRLLEDQALGAETARLLFRVGDWAASARLAGKLAELRSSSRRGDAWFSALRTLATIRSKTGRRLPYREITGEHARGARQPIVRVELLAYLNDDRLEKEVTEVSDWQGETRVLRLAILRAPSPQLIVAYFKNISRLPRDQAQRDSLNALVEACYGADERPQIREEYARFRKAGRNYEAFVNAADALFRLDRQAVLGGFEQNDLTSEALDVIRSDHRDWLWPLTFSLDRDLRHPKGRPEKILDQIGVTVSRTRLLSKSALTGQDVVDAAEQAGKLLLLAEAVAEGKGPLDEYPSTVSDIGQALLGWDDRLKQQGRVRSNRPKQPTGNRSPPKKK